MIVEEIALVESPEVLAPRRLRSFDGRRRLAQRTLDTVVRIASISFLLCFVALGLLLIARHHYDADLRPLLDHHRLNKVPTEGSRPTPNTILQDRMRTYYPRSCSREDLTTRDYRDLMVPLVRGTSGDVGDAVAATKTAAQTVLTHGVAIFPSTLDGRLADSFRNYTLHRNRALDDTDQVYVMNAQNGKRRTRWSFAFGGNDRAHESYIDHPSVVPDVLKAIASHTPLAQTLEALLGPDPAVVKMQTITAIRGAGDQGWHPDVNARAGAASHARNFALHLSLFVPLQDATYAMGSTGICPGSQFCTEIDGWMEDRCMQVASGLEAVGSSANNNRTRHVWRAGDAVLMNQNTFHRGAAHTDRNGGERAIIVITFASRPRESDGTLPEHPTRTPLPEISGIPRRGDESVKVHARGSNRLRDRHHGAETRILGLGTPLTSFGYTLRDMANPVQSMSRFWSPLRCLGMAKPPEAHWGWDFLASLPGRVATESHRLKRDDLVEWLWRQQRADAGWFARVCFRCFLLERVPAAREDRGIWDVWFDASLAKGVTRLRRWLARLLVAILLAAGALAHASRRNGNLGELPSSSGPSPAGFLGRLALAALLLVGIHWRVTRRALVKDIRSGIKLRPAFPPTEGWRRRGVLASNATSRYNTGAFNDSAPAFVTPSREDVLVGTRLHSLYLSGMNRFVDFHQGNRRWRRSIDGLGVPGLSSFWMDAMASSIVERQLKEGRFLYQSREDRRFVEIPKAEGQRFTRRALVASFVPLVAELDWTVSFMISHLLFESVLRDTSLCKVAAGNLELLRERMFREVSDRAVPPNNRVRRRRRPMFRVSTLRVKIDATVPKYAAPTPRTGSTSKAAGSSKKRRRADPKRIIALNKRKKKRK